jgi:HEAT repeat protein
VDDREEWEAVRADLRAAGVDPTDLGRFVNRSNPALPGFEPERFDAKAAYPVLLDWLPRARSRALRSTIASRLRQAGKSSVTAQALITEYRRETDETTRWQLGDAIARSATPADLPDIVELAADRHGGRGRQMLVYALWRVKTDRAREVILDLLDDPDVAGHAMVSLRRAAGNEEARRRIESLQSHPDARVRELAEHELRKIHRAR